MLDGKFVRMGTVGRNEKGDIIVEHLTPVICAAVAPVRPHAYVLAFNGGRHWSIKGNYQFFEANQSKIAGALNRLHSAGSSSNIDVVLCGSMTPAQKTIVHNKREIDATFYLHLIRWFKAHHSGFDDVTLDCPTVNLVEDAESPHNTDEEGDPLIEMQCEDGLFYFTSGNEPRKETSVFKTTRELAVAILENQSSPTLVIQGGWYARHNESRSFENVLPIQFPFGSGGPTLKRKTPISEEELLCHYLRLSLPQFKKSDFVFLACQALRRIMSYRSALVKCRPIIDTNGCRMGEQISKSRRCQGSCQRGRGTKKNTQHVNWFPQSKRQHSNKVFESREHVLQSLWHIPRGSRVC